MAEPTATPCTVCGLSPTRVEKIRRHEGMILLQRFVSFERPLCRVHGLELTRRYLFRTLWQGWWGLISFFVNWGVIAADLIVLLRYRGLAEPSVTSTAAVVAPAPPGPAATVPWSTPAGWYPDPAGRYEHRWFDGHTWTADVAHSGQTGHDPLPAA